VGGVDGQGGEEFDRHEGKIRSEGNKAGDAGMIAGSAATGASVGLIAGAASRNYALGGGIGAAAGAMAGLMAVLLTRGPDAVLAKGSTIEMITDRPMEFQKSEVDFGMVQSGHFSAGSAQLPATKGSIWARWPL
jgi:hypothetical protein